MTVNGHDAPRSKAFGWANQFRIDESGAARLRFNTPITRYALLAIQIGLWTTAVRRLLRWRKEERPQKAATA
jgi:hypothetical protein